MKYKVGVSRLPERGWERQETVGWLIRTITEMRQDERISEVISLLPSDTTPAPMLRNEIVCQAKAAGCSYLLSLDSDMVPDLPGQKPFWPTAWEFMMKRRIDECQWKHSFGYDQSTGHPCVPKPATIAAPYCGPPPDEVVYIFRWTNREGNSPNPNFRLEMISRDHAAISTGIQEVAALPTGLILYDMRVFDILPPPWYRYEYRDATESSKATTEDVYQTRNSSLLGLPVYCAFDCWAGHHKGKVVGKPYVVTRDEVHSSLVEAVKRGIDSGDRLVVLGDKGVSQVRGAEAPGGIPHQVRDGGQPPVLLQGVHAVLPEKKPQHEERGTAAPPAFPDHLVGQEPQVAIPFRMRPRDADKVTFDPMDHEVPAEDLAALKDLAARARRNGRTAVEVGAWAGHSTLVLADLLYDVFAVDHWQGSDRLLEIVVRRGQADCLRTFCRNMGQRLFRNVFPCHGSSAFWASAWPQSRPIDFLYIDADHDYYSVSVDICDWLPHVRKGGLVVCHDHGIFDGVTRAVEELLPGFQRAGRTLAYWEVADGR